MSLFNQTLKNSLKWQSAKVAIDLIRDNVIHLLKNEIYHDTIVVNAEINALVGHALITEDIANFLKENYYWFGHRDIVEYLPHPQCRCMVSTTNELKPLYDAAAFQIQSKLNMFKDSYESFNEIPNYTARCEWKSQIHPRLAEMLRVWIVKAFELCVREKQPCPDVPNVFSTLIRFNYTQHIVYHEDIVDLDGNDIEETIHWGSAENWETPDSPTY